MGSDKQREKMCIRDRSRYTGRAKEQTEAFIANVVQPVLDAHKDLLGVKVEINV